jgi:hypothetical protein
MIFSPSLSLSLSLSLKSMLQLRSCWHGHPLRKHAHERHAREPRRRVTARAHHLPGLQLAFQHGMCLYVKIVLSSWVLVWRSGTSFQTVSNRPTPGWLPNHEFKACVKLMRDAVYADYGAHHARCAHAASARHSPHGPGTCLCSSGSALPVVFWYMVSSFIRSARRYNMRCV